MLIWTGESDMCVVEAEIKGADKLDNSEVIQLTISYHQLIKSVLLAGMLGTSVVMVVLMGYLAWIGE